MHRSKALLQRDRDCLARTDRSVFPVLRDAITLEAPVSISSRRIYTKRRPRRRAAPSGQSATAPGPRTDRRRSMPTANKSSCCWASGRSVDGMRMESGLDHIWQMSDGKLITPKQRLGEAERSIQAWPRP